MNQLAHSVQDHQTHSNGAVFYQLLPDFLSSRLRLRNNSGKLLSKTSRQLLSIIVSNYNNSDSNEQNELQQSYYFFEQELGVCQKRVKQCLNELQAIGFITFNLATIIRDNFKCRNTICIKLGKDFLPDAKKLSTKPETIFYSSGNKLSVGWNKISSSVENFYSPYIDISIKSKSRSSESNFKNFIKQDLEEDKIEASSTPMLAESDNHDNDPKISEKVKSWNKKYNLACFYPLNEDDAELLRIRSAREFNLDFINKLLLKLSEQYPDHSFYSKELFLTYMTKALACEMRNAASVNNEGFKFRKNDSSKAKDKPTSPATVANSGIHSTLIDNLDSNSIWYKVRKSLINHCGISVDSAWFSKLEVAEEDQINKKLFLKPPTRFFHDWIKSNYYFALEQAFDKQGFSFEIMKL